MAAPSPPHPDADHHKHWRLAEEIGIVSLCPQESTRCHTRSQHYANGRVCAFSGAAVFLLKLSIGAETTEAVEPFPRAPPRGRSQGFRCTCTSTFILSQTTANAH